MCHQSWVEGNGHLLVTFCLMQRLFGLITKAISWLVSKLVFNRTSRSFSAKLLPRWPAPSTYWCSVLFLPMCRDCLFPTLNFAKFLYAHFSSLLRSFWKALQPFGVSASPPSFVSPASLQKVHTIPAFQYWPLGTPPVTLMQLNFVKLITALSVDQRK